MTVRGMTKKQIIILLERMIQNDNICITEGDMVMLFDHYGDTFEAESNKGQIIMTMTQENTYWKGIRQFIPRLGHKLKGYTFL